MRCSHHTRLTHPLHSTRGGGGGGAGERNNVHTLIEEESCPNYDLIEGNS